MTGRSTSPAGALSSRGARADRARTLSLAAVDNLMNARTQDWAADDDNMADILERDIHLYAEPTELLASSLTL